MGERTSLRAEPFSYRCLSCGLVYDEPVEWCPPPCITDLRDSNNRVPVIATQMFFTVPLTRRQRIRRCFTWPYIRQTRLLLPLTEWWLNRG